MTNNDTIEMPSLGRPFQLGMLYDCRTDKLIPGITLWNPELLSQNISSSSQKSSNYEVIAHDSIEDKTNALNIEASLKASFLGGLVSVSGSAKYLSDRKSSKSKARVSLKYSTTSKFTQLTMAQLGRGNFEHPNVFEEKLATHVVTGIQYGADAFFVFDKEAGSNENMMKVHGELEAVIKGIPCIDIEGRGRVDVGETQNGRNENFQCTFYGDFRLTKNPYTFQEAVEVYKTLPSLLGENEENVVPKKVWLYPLQNLDSKAAKLVREISVGLVNDIQNILETLHEVRLETNELLSSTTLAYFPEMNQNIKLFQNLVVEYKAEFQKSILPILPLVRGGQAEERKLADVITRHRSSIFSGDKLTSWLEVRQREENNLAGFIRSLKDHAEMATTEEICGWSTDFSFDYLLVFNFQVESITDGFISKMRKFLRTKQEFSEAEMVVETWSSNPDVINTISSIARNFFAFVALNKKTFMTELKLKVCASSTKSLTMEGATGANILLHTFGLVKPYILPFKPNAPKASTVTHNSVTLSGFEDSLGVENITSYTVFYIETNQKSEPWLQQEIKSQNGTLLVEGLASNREYKFKISTKCLLGNTEESAESLPVRTKAFGQVKPYILPFKPNAPKATTVTHNSVTLSGFQDSFGVANITSYTVFYIETNQKSESWLQQEIKSQNGTLVVEGLASNREYKFKISANCLLGNTEESAESLPVRTKAVPGESRLAIKMQGFSTLSEQKSPSVYKLPITEAGHDKLIKLRICEIGEPSFPEPPEKIVIMLGATGSGKTTVINGMSNFIYGVEWKDDFRFKVIADGDEGSSDANNQAFSQTKYITSYKFHHQADFPLPYTVTLIDTPGFGNTEGIKRDEEIVKQIRELFERRGKLGINHLDAIGFVVQAPNARLTHTQQYILDSILSIFGKDVIENIFILITFADGGTPQVLNAIRAANITYTDYFKFNNSALFSPNKAIENDEDDNFDQMFWKIGIRSYIAFFTALNTVTSKSLQMTREVLKERQKLETSIEGVHIWVQVGLAKLDTLTQEEAIIRQFEAQIETNKDFKYSIDVTKQRKIDICSGKYVTNCLTCNFTCHFPCAIPNDADKAGCASMRNGSCIACPGRCFWNLHVNNPYRFELYQDTETRTSDELRTRYLDAKNSKSRTEDMVNNLKQEFDEIQKGVCAAIMSAKNSVNKLNKIAAKSNPLSTVDYIDLLIKSEEMGGKLGFQARIHHLQGAKKKAEFFETIQDPNYDPWLGYNEQLEVHSLGSGEKSKKAWYKRGP